MYSWSTSQRGLGLRRRLAREEDSGKAKELPDGRHRLGEDVGRHVSRVNLFQAQDAIGDPLAQHGEPHCLVTLTTSHFFHARSIKDSLCVELQLRGTVRAQLEFPQSDAKGDDGLGSPDAHGELGTLAAVAQRARGETLDGEGARTREEERVASHARNGKRLEAGETDASRVRQRYVDCRGVRGGAEVEAGREGHGAQHEGTKVRPHEVGGPVEQGLPNVSREVDHDERGDDNGAKRPSGRASHTTYMPRPRIERAVEILSGKSGLVADLGWRMRTNMSEFMGEAQGAATG